LIVLSNVVTASVLVSLITDVDCWYCTTGHYEHLICSGIVPAFN